MVLRFVAGVRVRGSAVRGVAYGYADGQPFGGAADATPEAAALRGFDGGVAFFGQGIHLCVFIRRAGFQRSPPLTRSTR